MKATKETWVRTAVLILTLINQILIVCEKNPLPFGEEQIYEGLSMLLTAFVSLWNWWKNNSFTEEAVQADVYLKKMKEEKENG